ncbi:MAG: LPXTG cell wall anchor domain-containing protein [Iamia sp.]
MALPPLLVPENKITAELIASSVTCTAAPDDVEPTVPPPTPPTTGPTVTTAPSAGGTGTTTPPTTGPTVTTAPSAGGTGTTAPAPPVGELPRTGGSTSTGLIAGLGVALVGAGALSLAASRRARGSHTV